MRSKKIPQGTVVLVDWIDSFSSSVQCWRPVESLEVEENDGFCFTAGFVVTTDATWLTVVLSVAQDFTSVDGYIIIPWIAIRSVEVLANAE